MNKIQKYTAISISALYLILGLFWSYIGVLFSFESAIEGNLMVSAFTLVILALGFIMVVIGYQAIVRQNVTTIRNLCRLVGFTAFSVINHTLQPIIDTMHPSNGMIRYSALMLIPIIFGIIVYKVALKAFGMGNNQDTQPCL